MANANATAHRMHTAPVSKGLEYMSQVYSFVSLDLVGQT
jgi:hypothetical protein